MTLTVGIYLFDEVEVLDFAGPFEVFSTAARVKSRLDSQAVEAFKVFTIADEQRTVAARGNLLVQPHYALTDHPPLDMLIIPGGVVTAELERKPVIDWIATVAQTTEVTASVCTGAFLLAKAGLLHNQPAITHWEDIDDLRTM
ncbi:MAG: DJ-1/PfpI family protein, partial [Anaerolineae bacterium]|nr:DJ-1/PfpI family protein [Anaerolineae bacterium]